MNRSLKTLLLWLLISLLPMQGMAVVMSASCNMVTPTAANDGAQHHAASAHCPSDDAICANAEGVSDEIPDASLHHACSACAACCVGASAPPSAALPAAVHALSESRFAAPGVPGGGFIPAGLERPPKSVFA